MFLLKNCWTTLISNAVVFVCHKQAAVPPPQCVKSTLLNNNLMEHSILLGFPVCVCVFYKFKEVCFILAFRSKTFKTQNMSEWLLHGLMSVTFSVQTIKIHTCWWSYVHAHACVGVFSVTLLPVILTSVVYSELTSAAQLPLQSLYISWQRTCHHLLVALHIVTCHLHCVLCYLEQENC